MKKLAQMCAVALIAASAMIVSQVDEFSPSLGSNYQSRCIDRPVRKMLD